MAPVRDRCGCDSAGHTLCSKKRSGSCAAEELAMSAPQQPGRREHESVEAIPPQQQLDPVSGPDGDSGGPDGDSGDQDIDTAGTEHDDESPTAAGPAARRRGRADSPDASFAEAPDNERRPIGPSDPGSMHRREDDAEAMAKSSDFHDTAATVARPAIDRHR